MQHVSPLNMAIYILYRDLAAIDKRNQRRSKTKGEAACRGLYLNPMVGKQSSSAAAEGDSRHAEGAFRRIRADWRRRRLSREIISKGRIATSASPALTCTPLAVDRSVKQTGQR